MGWDTFNWLIALLAKEPPLDGLKSFSDRATFAREQKVRVQALPDRSTRDRSSARQPGHPCRRKVQHQKNLKKICRRRGLIWLLVRPESGMTGDNSKARRTTNKIPEH